MGTSLSFVSNQVLFISFQMNKICFILFSVCVLLTACGNKPSDKTAQQTPAEDTTPQEQIWAEMSFDSTDFDFGRFSRTQTPVVSHVFTFTNTGEAPLIITKVYTSCDCTTVEYPHDSVMPGDMDSIKVIFNGVGMPLETFRRTVDIEANIAGGGATIIIAGDMVE